MSAFNFNVARELMWLEHAKLGPPKQFLVTDAPVQYSRMRDSSHG
jgi:hypothetical protein